MVRLKTLARLAAVSALALASAAQASVIYTFTGEYVSERDDEGNTLATSTATWTYTAADFVTAYADITPDSCDSGNAGFFCAATQRIEPYPSSFGGDIGGDYIGLNLNTADGSGTGFYWFQPGAFGAVGTYSNAGWPNPSCSDTSGCYGNAGVATLTVSMGGNAVPEPASWAMLVAGFGIVGAGLRRRSLRVAYVSN
jgi:hypothetical protein